MPFYICPRCKTRRLDNDSHEGLSLGPPSCHHCDFGFMFQLLEDYYPAPATGLIVCDHAGRVLATGHGIFELTGYEEPELMGLDLVSALQLSDSKPMQTVREWGVRQLGQHLSLRIHAGLEKDVVADFFPEYDDEEDDGGMLVALTPV